MRLVTTAGPTMLPRPRCLHLAAVRDALLFRQLLRDLEEELRLDLVSRPLM